ncbi:MAG: hypothetical protein ACLSVD_00285 [Eggerthellaceae bacterium]
MKAGGDAAGSAAAGGETQYAWEAVPDPITGRHVDGGHRHPRHRRRFGRLRVSAAAAEKGRQGDRRREDAQLERRAAASAPSTRTTWTSWASRWTR